MQIKAVSCRKETIHEQDPGIAAVFSGPNLAPYCEQDPGIAAVFSGPNLAPYFKWTEEKWERNHCIISLFTFETVSQHFFFWVGLRKTKV